MKNKIEWKRIQLDTFAEIIRGMTYSSKDVKNEIFDKSIPVLRAGNIQSNQLVYGDFVYIPRKLVSEDQILQSGDILLATSSGSKNVVGKTGFVNNHILGTFGAFCCVVRTREVLSNFLRFYFQSSDYKKFISSTLHGVNINNLKISEIRSMKVPLPFSKGEIDLKEEERIATILEKTEQINHKHKKAINLLDEYLQSVFNEMFGNPNKPTNNFPRRSFLNCLEKESSNNNLKIKQSNFLTTGKYPIIDQGVNFIAGYTLDEKKLYSGKLPVILFGDHTRILKLVNFSFALGADGVKVLVPKDEINPHYLYHCLKLLDLPSAGYSRHYKFLKAKSIYIPPMSLQLQFAKIAKHVESMKKKIKSEEQKSRDLLNYLIQKAFNGEL